MVPSAQTVFPGSLIPNAPEDLYTAMGARGQRIYVVPGLKMAIVGMGNSSDKANRIWQRIMGKIKGHIWLIPALFH